MVRLDLLIDTGDGERYQVAPIVEALMSLDRLKELGTWLRAHNGGSAEELAAEPVDEAVQP